MAKRRLDTDLLDKMVKKTCKSKQYLREQVSRRASRNAVSSLAAQLLWARELGFGITSALNRADSTIRDEIRATPAATPAVANHIARRSPRPIRHGREPNLGATID